LAKKARTKLERVLQIFSPIYQTTADKHQLDFQGDTDDPLVKKMVDRLGRAIASEEIREKMDVEDELDRIFEREMKKLAAEKDEIIAEKEEIIAEKDQLLVEEKKRAEEEKKRAEEEVQKNLELQRQIEALKKQIKP
jgi:CRISPR/Cas system CMR subunit Cmr4 (Cas7 group RAMP superfamily)